MNPYILILIKIIFGIFFGFFFGISNYIKQISIGNRINVMNPELIEENFIISFCLGFIAGFISISFIF